ncbi:MAG: hypothetical protein ABL999_06770 [Pyrinomonadaceae bacterium]
MPPEIHRYVPWLILFSSFAILAVFYGSLPHEVIIARAFFGGAETLAPKSLFTVFRVPLTDAICAAAAALLYRKFLLVAPNLANFWLVLLYTAVFKSLLQAIEIAAPPDIVGTLFYLTLFVVVAGIAAAFYISRKHLSGFTKGLGKFGAGETMILTILLFAYLGIAIVPLFVFQ